MSSHRESILKTLHTAATEIQDCESVKAVFDRTISTAEVVLEFEMCSILLHDDGWLTPAAMSSGAPTDGARKMASDQGLAGKTFQTGESHLTDDINSDDMTDPAKEFYRSGMSVPIGDHGVFQAVSDQPAAFDNSDIEFAELLLAHTIRTVDRLRFEEELETQKREIQRQNDRLEEFVDVVSHDLRNPLEVATGYLQLAQETCDSDHLDTVARAQNRMGVLIDELLELAKEGNSVGELTPVNLAALATECWQQVNTGGATLFVDTDRNILGDPTRLRQVFENLFRNAIEHGSDDVTVVIGNLAETPGFFVADDGPGIPEGGLDDVFKRGFSTTATGTGFGLAIVRDIVETHGWLISVSDSDDGGARFEITGVELAS